MDELRWKVFEAELRAQMKEIEKLYSRIEERREDFRRSPIATESLGYQLHNLYCAFEDLLRLVADYFENAINTAQEWHRGLLRRMRVEVEGVRPALLSEESYRLLDELRAFRHLFRHAYGYELDSEKVGIVLKKALKLKEIYTGDVEGFLSRLRGAEG